MKIKFLTTVMAICLASSSLAFAAEPVANTPATETAKNTATTKEKKTSTVEKNAADIKDIKTFDFERIFREAAAYYDAAQKWKTLKCYPKTAFVCAKRECPKIKLEGDSALILDKKNETLAMCHNKVCQYYNVKFEQTGVFISVEVKNMSGMLIKILGDSRFKEVTLVGLDAYITNGECEVLD